jgi:LmbE family N-acetylglucosaminyl deacetylase
MSRSTADSSTAAAGATAEALACAWHVVARGHDLRLVSFGSEVSLSNEFDQEGYALEPVAVMSDTAVERALVIVAHPDDADFWAGGTIARWADSGAAVTYLVLTNGEGGGFDEDVPRSEIPGMRQEEQRKAAAVLGVTEVRFLSWPEGSLAQSTEARRPLVRVIREVRPQRVLTWSPEWNWSRFRTSCHVDHRATGELALTSIYPDAGNRFSHASLLHDEGLDPWRVPEIWLINSPTSNHYVDVTATFDRKIAALREHASQTGHRDRLVEEMRERIAPNTAAAGLPAGRLAEAFQVVLNE